MLGELKTRGFSVQLKHIAEETTWEEHGFVRVLTTSGKVLCESKNYQHNVARVTPEELLKELPAADDAVYA